MKFLFAALVVVVAVLAHDHHEHDHVEGEVEPRTCGTPHLTQEEVQTEDAMSQRFVDTVCAKFPDLNICPTKTVKKVTEVCLWMHVIFDPRTNEGNIPESQIAAQFQAFNDDFGGRNNRGNGRGGFETNFQFRLAGVTRTGNAAWFSNIQGNEVAATTALAVDPCRCQQVYFSRLSAGLLGYCYLPNSFPSCSTRHGCFNAFDTVPGGGRTNYNLGQTVTHEVGHGFGLLHVFQNAQCTGCGGDQVCDTNPQRTSTSGCPAAKDSCNNGRQDNYHNFLDYSIDRCMNEFTRGQSERMDAQIAQFRPGFLGADFKDTITAVIPDAFAEAERVQAYNEAHPKLYGLNATVVSN